jgi:hypothetical protein
MLFPLNPLFLYLLFMGFHTLKFAGILVLLSLFACRKASNSADADQLAPADFSIAKPFWRLRTAPGSVGKVIRELKPGEVVHDLGEVTDYFTILTLQQVTYNEPWIKVRTKAGEEGWLFGAVLSFEQSGSQRLAQILLEKRFQSLFGAVHTRSMRQYLQLWDQVQTVESIARIYRQGHAFVDSLSQILETKIQVGEGSANADLFWLGKMTPGFIPQLIAEGSTYHLFADFRKFWQKARTTSSKEDDDYFGLCVQLFPEDSIEYYFPAYFLQTTDEGGSSLLGRGIHRKILVAADSLKLSAPLFAVYFDAIKNNLVDDITNTNTTYWEQKDKIMAELTEIVALDLAILTKADNIALKTRLLQFRKPQKFGLSVNLQSGREE